MTRRSLFCAVALFSAALVAGPCHAQQADLPFSPSTSPTVGKTVKVTANNTPTSVAGTLDSTSGAASNILIVNNGTVVVFVRVSTEPQASIAATAADMPVPAGATRLIQNPAPSAKAGLAVLSSTASTNDVFFTPGNGRP